MTSILLALAVSAAAPDFYRVVTSGGELLEATGLTPTPEGWVLMTAEGPVVLGTDELDPYRTFRRNAEKGRCNVIFFRRGGWVRFDDIEFEDGIVRLGGPGGAVRVHEALVDFEASVRDGAMVLLPEGAGASVATAEPKAHVRSAPPRPAPRPQPAVRRGARRPPSR